MPLSVSIVMPTLVVVPELFEMTTRSSVLAMLCCGRMVNESVRNVVAILASLLS